MVRDPWQGRQLPNTVGTTLSQAWPEIRADIWYSLLRVAMWRMSNGKCAQYLYRAPMESRNCLTTDFGKSRAAQANFEAPKAPARYT